MPRYHSSRLNLILLILSCSIPLQAAENKLPTKWQEQKFQLFEGDRIAMLGNTLIEREQKYGYWETRLVLSYPDIKFTMRNLGWSGDNVYGESRARFGNRTEGYNHLQKSLELVKPTIVFVSYGSNAAYQGEAGLADFEKGYEQLLNSLERHTERIVLISPLKYENLGPPLPDQTEQNKRLKIYRDKIQDIAYRRGYLFLDLYKHLGDNFVRHEKTEKPLTDNGIHLNPYGYWEASFSFTEKLKNVDSLSKLEIEIPSPLSKSENKSVEQLRLKIIEKNELFFHRYRPQNETYLYLFRKHEQGNNAVEIPLFDPLITKKETEIEFLKKSILGNK